MRRFVARQPIFDRRQNLFAYELLFRSSQRNVYDHHDPTEASLRLISASLHLLGLETLIGESLGFFNVTRDVLLDGQADLLPPGAAVLELLESIEPDQEVVDGCSRLKDAGYRLALDDIVDVQPYEALLPLIDFVKIDFLLAGEEQRREAVDRLKPHRAQLIAEKVEDHATLEAAMQMGYSYFQGFYYCRPAILSSEDIPASKLNYLRIVRELSRQELDFPQIAEIVKREMALCYKLLRYINSTHFGLRGSIKSVERALVHLGERNVRSWASVVAFAEVATGKPPALIVEAASRARFREQIALRSGGLEPYADDLFLIGMLSLLDAVLDQQLERILDQLHVEDGIRSALLGGDGAMAAIHRCALAYERADWPAFTDEARRAGVDALDFARLYLEASEWADVGVSGL